MLLHNLSSKCSRIVTFSARSYGRFQIREAYRPNWTLGNHLGRPQQIRYRSNNADVFKTPKQVKVKLKSQDVTRLLSLARSEKWVLFGAMGCLVVSSAITMSVPFALGKILDIIFSEDKDKDPKSGEKTIERLKQFSLILCGIFLVGGLANFGRVYLFNSASLRIVRDLRTRVYNRMMHQETGWFDTKGSGELVNRLFNDTYAVGNSLSQNLSDGMRSVVMILAGTGMMVRPRKETQLAMMSTVVVPCVAGVAIVYGKFVRGITRSLLDRFAGIAKSAEERLSNVKTVKMFSKEGEENRHFASQLEATLKLGYREVLARSTFFGITGLAGNVIIVSVLYYGGSLVLTESLSIGALTSFILYAAYSAVSINGLSNFYTELNKGVGSAQRLWEIIDRQNSIPIDVGTYPTAKAKGEISFENVTFSFPSRPESIILKNFNLHMPPGETTAVCGRSGSGKTTLASLLLRLYDPLQGRIRLDGVDLTTLSPLWLRNQIGAVNQEPVLFSGSIRDNIMYGLAPGASISEEQFQQILRKTHVDEFVSRLPQGIETMVGQRGMMLSGGQKQRVAIARALIRNPAILILDEATSALDSVSEELVQNALGELAKGRTVLTIAHRLSTIRNAHKIVVLDGGRVVEQGRYEDLIANDASTFTELVRKQAFMGAS